MSLRSLLTLVVTLGCCAGVARADSLVFQEGTLLPGGSPYAATQDTEISEASPNNTYGASVSLRSDFDSFGGQTQALLRFETIFGALPDRIPPGSTIAAATLTLEALNASNVPIGVISVYRMTLPWSESSSWNALDGGVQMGTDTVASADDAHTVESLGSTSFDVQASLVAWAAGARNAGWVLLNDSTDGVQWWSSESDTVSLRPRLTVEFTPPNTTLEVPSLSHAGFATLLAALALGGAAALRWPARTRAGTGGRVG